MASISLADQLENAIEMMMADPDSAPPRVDLKIGELLGIAAELRLRIKRGGHRGDVGAFPRIRRQGKLSRADVRSAHTILRAWLSSTKGNAINQKRRFIRPLFGGAARAWRHSLQPRRVCRFCSFFALLRRPLPYLWQDVARHNELCGQGARSDRLSSSPAHKFSRPSARTRLPWARHL